MSLKINLCRILLITLAIPLTFTVAVADQSSTGTLTVVISNFRNSEGFAMVALSNSKQSYEQGADLAFAKKKGKIENAVCQVVFKDLPYGDYAVSLYHDENSNAEMDTNSMGIPKESYAFSNNARGMFGKPDWTKVTFKLDRAEKQINIAFK